MWNDNQGTRWELVDWEISPDAVASALTLAYFNLSLNSANGHYDGNGVNAGVDIDITLARVRNLSDRNNEQARHKAALETVIAGACWPADRIAAINDEYPSVCPRCFLAPETSLHTFWQCPCNRDIEHEYVTDSEGLADEAITGALSEPCLWLRGISPSHYTEISHQYLPTEELNIHVDNNHNVSWSSGTYYGDASGGKYTQYKALRRCGVGLVRFVDGVFHFGMHTNLPGPVQTVGRGELFALVLLVKHLQPNTEVDFVTDNENVAVSFNKGPKHCVNCINCDFYKIIFDHIQVKQLSVSVRWMPSHLVKGVKKRPADVSNEDIVANDKADELAEQAAKLVQLPNGIACNYINHAHKISKIQNRLATILLFLPIRNAREKQYKQPIIKQTIEELIECSAHSILIGENRLHCKVCLCSFACKDPSARAWLMAPCRNFSTSDSNTKPIKINDVIHMGNQVSHVSHSLYKFKDVIYCNKCGAMGKDHFVLLSKQCQSPGLAGERFLRSVQNGLLPKRLAIDKVQ